MSARELGGERAARGRVRVTRRAWARTSRVAEAARVLVWLVCLAFVTSTSAGCHRKAKADEVTADEKPPSALVVKDDSAGLLLTWIDDHGDFHVEQKVTDVPLAGRDAVRVVDPAREEGTHGDKIFVADLRNKTPDGTYPLHVTTRADFEALAEKRREALGPTLATAEEGGAVVPRGAASAQLDQQHPTTPHDPTPAGRPTVIIYGASWCGACHQAAAYLRQKGVAFVEKDIEEDPVAAREMKDKLAKNGLPRGSIPVIDVRGKVMVGFSPESMDEALGKAL